MEKMNGKKRSCLTDNTYFFKNYPQKTTLKKILPSRPLRAGSELFFKCFLAVSACGACSRLGEN